MSGETERAGPAAGRKRSKPAPKGMWGITRVDGSYVASHGRRADLYAESRPTQRPGVSSTRAGPVIGE